MESIVHTAHFRRSQVSAVATVLMVFILMPLYKTTGCDPQTLGLDTCLQQANLTDFEQLTIANVPPYSFSPLLNGTTAVVINGTTTVIIGQRDNPLDDLVWVPGLTGRYAAPALAMILITFYACYLLWHEWVECLALRRVYFLESDYFMERIEELDTIKCNKDPEDPFQDVRPPYLPHPEMRETIPNVALNSVLYRLPDHLKTYKTKTVDGKSGPGDEKNLLERQLDATVQFFDKCVPNQPGFTSSVVAVTIVPDAALVKGAWMKWYACGKKLRRLRYIKHAIQKRKEMQEAGVRGIHDYVDTAVKTTADVARATGKATTHVAKATGNAVIQLADKVRPASHSDNSVKTNAGKEESTKPSDHNDKQESQASDHNEENFQQPFTNTNMKNDESDHSESGDQPSSKKQASWLEKFATSVGFGDTNDDKPSKDEPKKGDKKTNVAENKPSASVCLGAENGVEQPLKVDTPGHGSVIKSGRTGESGILFDAIETGIEEPESNQTLPASMTPKSSAIEDRFEYQTFDPEEFAKWIGYAEETQCDEIVDTLGVEQLTAYSREMSQSASNPCVNGCNEQALSLWSIEELEDMLEDAEDAVREANAELLRVRADIFRKENKLPVLTKSKKDEEETNEEVDMPNMLPSEDKDDSRSRSMDIEEGVSLGTSSEDIGLRKRTIPSARAKYRMAQSLVNQVHSISSNVGQTRKEARCCDKSNLVCFAAKSGSRKVVKVLDHPTFAVVTFTSRQAAISARQCLADGKALDRWSQVDAIPVPPLADAPPRDIFFCRGCCRPVTLTINPKERKMRQVAVWTFYVFFCCLYSIPLAITSAVLDPTYLAAAFPDAEVWENSNGVFYRLFAGISSGMLYSLFFSVLPQIFKYMAFMLGSASTIQNGEDNALKFYWYFMLVTAFTGSTLASMLLRGLFEGNFSQEFKDGLTSVARTIPTSQAPVWLNWMIT
jgi:hypothetical protein